MPLCPYCHTVVSEDYQFCPECGRTLATGEVVVGGRVEEGKSKKKLAGIIVACIVAVIVIAVIATHPPTSLEPEPAIPARFDTYTDEQGLFSISYPPEWEPALEVMEEAEQAIKDIITNINSDLPVEKASFIFIAYPPSETDFLPNASIVVEPCPLLIRTHNEMVKAEIEGIKAVDPDCHELSRVTTTVDGRTATILVSRGTFPGAPTSHYVQMFLLVGRTIWCVTCTSSLDEYSELEDDFDAIVRSLRILK